MSLKTNPPTAPATVAPSATEAAAWESDAVEYPDRPWTAPSVWHGHAVALAAGALNYLFRAREDVMVAMELVVYYERGDNTAWLRPDVQLAFGVGRGWNRYSYKVWDEGKAPDFVLEVASPSTAEHDARHMAAEYARIGVREYWRLDPEGTLMGAALEGYTATGGGYEPVEPVERPDRGRYLRSRVLGLDLRSRKGDGATLLVFADPRTGEECDGEPREPERRRGAEERILAARARAAAERDRALAAEARARVLEQQIRNLESRAGPSD